MKSPSSLNLYGFDHAANRFQKSKNCWRIDKRMCKVEYFPVSRNLTSFVSVLSNNTTLPPRSPVARWSPVLSNSIAEMISTANIEKQMLKFSFCRWKQNNRKIEGNKKTKVRCYHKFQGT